MARSANKSQRRRNRVRRGLRMKATDRPRLSIFRSAKNISAQVIDDKRGMTIAQASSLGSELKGTLKNGGDRNAAAAVGRLVAERAAKAGVQKVYFDRGAYLYHGRVRALADAAREAGLQF